jgi:drug/metabolite transporter (DMT)-like permease
MKVELKADLCLILVTMFWGISCLLTKIGLGGIQEFNLIALRFVIAFLVSAFVFNKKLRNIDLITLKYSAITGTLLFTILTFMTFGVKYTSVSNAGFLTCLEGIFVPILLFVFLKQKQEPKVWVAVCLAFMGVYLLTIHGIQGTISFNIGDFFCVLCSLGFAVFILVTDRLTKKVDSLSLGILQLGFVGIYSLIFSFALESPILPATTQSWLVVLALSLLCSAFGFITMPIAQQHTSPTHTGIIFCLEPAFAAFFAFIFLKEILSPRGYLGAFLLIASILLVEVDIHKLKTKKC